MQSWAWEDESQYIYKRFIIYRIVSESVSQWGAGTYVLIGPLANISGFINYLANGETTFFFHNVQIYGQLLPATKYIHQYVEAVKGPPLCYNYTFALKLYLKL